MRPPTTGYPCPYCETLAAVPGNCPGCGQGTDPMVAHLAAVDTDLRHLDLGIHQARQALESLLAQSSARQRERAELITALSARIAARRSLAPASPIPAPQPGPAPWGRPGGRADADPRTVQNLLFGLGGLLVAVGAIVFVLFAVARYGLAGAEVALVGATALAFVAPIPARTRGLRATAETVALLALLLLTLDGCLARALQDGPVTATGLAGYLAGLAALVAGVAAGYGTVLRLTGARVVAVLAAQPVGPLLLVSAQVGALSSWVVGITAIAVGNLVAAALLRPGRLLTTRPVAAGTDAVRYGLGIGALAVGLAWLAVATMLGLGGLGYPGGSPGAELLAMCVVAVATAGFAAWTGPGLVRQGLLALAIVEFGLVGLRAGVTWVDAPALVTGAAITVLLAGASAGLRRTADRLADLRAGFVGAAAAALGVLAVGTLPQLVGGALIRLGGAFPAWHADLAALAGPALPVAGQLVAVVALVGAATLLCPRGWRTTALIAAAPPVVIAVQNLPRLAWWTPVALAGAAALALTAVVARSLTAMAGAAPRTDAAGRQTLAVAAVGAAGLAVDALLGGLARPVSTAVTLAGLAATGAAMGYVGRWLPVGPIRRDWSGVGLVVALLAAPGAVAATAATAAVGNGTLLRLTLATVVVELIVLPTLQTIRGYAVPALALAATVVGLLPVVVPGSASPTRYALVGLLVIAVAARYAAPSALGYGAVLAIPAAVGVLPLVGDVLALPYGWLARIWSGAPAGVGLSPEPWHLDGSDALAMALLLGVAVLGGNRVLGGWRGVVAGGGPVGIVGVLVALAAAGVPWPLVPLASVLLGAVAVLAAGLVWRGSWLVATAVTGLAALAAGVAGLSPTVAGTLGGLGAVLVVATVVGVAGRTVPERLAGWLVAVGAGQALAYAGDRAAPEVFGPACYPTTVTAALALVVGAALIHRGRQREGRALVAAGHAGALVALLTAGTLSRAGVVAAAWGVVIGGRALWPGLSAPTRRVLVSVAAAAEVLAWWLLLAARGVSTVDWYTLPLAGAALLAGWLATRSRPGLGSWVAFGPALAAGLLPSLAPVLTGDGALLRRALVGLAALAVVLVGAHLRLQAPVLVGGGVLLVLAMHELAPVVLALPTWLPLTLAGLLVLGFAVTYERRRRDLHRLRSALFHLH